MRIAHVVASYHPLIGGVETHVQRLAQGCAETGDNVTILTHQVDDSPLDEWIDEVRVRRFPLTIKSRTYPLSLSMFQHLRMHAAAFDLVHVHSYHTLVGHAASGTRLPLIFTPHYHGTGHTPLRAFLHHLYRPAGERRFEASDAVICVSEAERDLVVRHFPGVARKTVVIPNGTDPRPSVPENETVLQGGKVVLTVGRLERYKNVDLIIEAFRALPSSATLVIVGHGPDRARLEQRAARSTSGWPILFLGKVSEAMLTKLLAQTTVMTSASDHEAFGLTLAEGLASGARVVASAIPAHVALARLAGPEAPVALVDARDTEQFTGRLAASLSAGRCAVGRFGLPSWAEVVKETRDVYSQVLSHGCLVNRRGP